MVLRGWSVDLPWQNYVIREDSREYLLTRTGPPIWLYIEPGSHAYYRATSSEQLFALIDANTPTGYVWDQAFDGYFGDMYSDHIHYMKGSTSRSVNLEKGVLYLYGIP